MTRADSITFDPSAEGTQTGSTVDTEFDPGVDLSWSVENTNYVEREDSQTNHTLLGADDEGEPLTYVGVFTQGTGWQGNAGRVSLAPGSAFTHLHGDGFSSVAKNNDTGVEMAVFRSAG